MKLSLKERRFVAEYLKDQNGTQAAIRAGYSPKGADVQASRLLGKDRVASALADKLKGIEARSELTQEIVRDRILSLLTFKPEKAFNPDGTLKRISEMDDQTRQAIAGVDVDESGGDVKRIRFTDRTRAAELAAKVLGMLSFQLTGKGGTPLVPPSTRIDFSGWSKQELLKAAGMLPNGTGESH